MEFKIIKRIDGLGRVVIPIEIRKAYGIELNNNIEMIPFDNGILLRSAKNDETGSERKENN